MANNIVSVYSQSETNNLELMDLFQFEQDRSYIPP